MEWSYDCSRVAACLWTDLATPSLQKLVSWTGGSKLNSTDTVNTLHTVTHVTCYQVLAGVLHQVQESYAHHMKLSEVFVSAMTWMDRIPFILLLSPSLPPSLPPFLLPSFLASARVQTPTFKMRLGILCSTMPHSTDKGYSV